MKEYTELKTEVDSLLRYKYDWDGHGGLPTNEGIIRTIQLLLATLEVLNLDPPFIELRGKGSVALRWERLNPYLSMELEVEKVGFYNIYIGLDEKFYGVEDIKIDKGIHMIATRYLRK